LSATTRESVAADAAPKVDDRPTPKRQARPRYLALAVSTSKRTAPDTQPAEPRPAAKADNFSVANDAAKAIDAQAAADTTQLRQMTSFRPTTSAATPQTTAPTNSPITKVFPKLPSSYSNDAHIVAIITACITAPDANDTNEHCRRLVCAVVPWTRSSMVSAF